MCGDMEDRLAREWIDFEDNVENQVVQAMHNISEVTASFFGCRRIKQCRTLT